MQRKNFLFERSDLNEATSTVLFKKWEFEKVDLANSSKNLLSQFNVSHKLCENTNVLSFYTTPPMEKKSTSIPKAPMKHKKLPRKGDLKPKKLQYSDEESDIANAMDSGVHLESIQSNDTFFCKQHNTKCNRLDSSQKRTCRSRPIYGKIKGQINDKENDKSVVKHKSTNTPNSINNVTQASSVVFHENTDTSDTNLNWKDILYLLQPQRDIGLWIQCNRCHKWRYVEDYHDPVNVPKRWFCEMNSDKSKVSCNIPEQYLSPEIKFKIIENTYNAGSIVWAHIHGFPWWPGLVNDCPDTYTYYKLYKNSIKPVKYYVTFFNEEKLECAWIHTRNLKPLATNKYSQFIKKTKVYGIEYKETLQKAYNTALNALSLSILERLRKYSFVAQYDRFYDMNNNTNESVSQTNMEIVTDSDDEIQCSSATEHLTLKNFYLKVLCNSSDNDTK